MKERTWSEQGYSEVAEVLDAARRAVSDEHGEILVKCSGSWWYWHGIGLRHPGNQYVISSCLERRYGYSK